MEPVRYTSCWAEPCAAIDGSIPVTAGGPAALTVTDAVAKRVGSADEVAWMMTVWAVAGALNRPLELMVPRLASPQFVAAAPDVPAVWHSDHATPVFRTPGPVTEAVSWSVSPVARVAVEGVIWTRIPESMTVVKKPNAVFLTQLVATTKKLSGFGGELGAV